MTGIKYPKGERVWVRYYTAQQQPLFIMTTKESSRDYYFLYELSDNEFKRLGKSRSPLELEEKYRLNERLRAAQ